MSLFSYEFFIFWAVALLLYYGGERCLRVLKSQQDSFEGNSQWLVLLAASLYFYARMCNRFPLVLLLVSVTTFAGVKWYESGHRRKGWIYALVLLNLLYLVLGRETGLVAILGNSYFTLKAIGYVIEVEREQTKSFSNYPRMLLYLIYFPTVMQGPFNRSNDFENSLKKHVTLDMTAVLHGIQRFVWGTLKKLVVAERLAPFVDCVYGNLENMNGITVLIATVGYAIQLYADFSGCMDMMLGVSQTFGIALPENFKRPYFAQTAADFWRRWHITLGHWFRDFVMFTFVMSPVGKKINKACKKKWKKGKLVVPILGTMLVWICTGLWHGLGNNYLIWGIYYGVIISASLLLEDRYILVKKKLHIRQESSWYRIMCMMRTWCIVLAADVVIRCPDLKSVWVAFQKIFTEFGTTMTVEREQIGWSGTFPFAAALFCIFAVSCIQEKGIDILAWLDKQKLPVRWGAYYLVIFVVFLFGIYGASYDTSQFLYGMF